MKNLVLLVVLVCCLAGAIFAKDDLGNIMVVTTLETKSNSDGSVAEFDSLNQLFTDKVLKKNELILSAKTVRHMWGHNNRDFLVMYEVKNWADVEKANEKNDELFKKAWSTEESRKEFNKKWNAYFSGKHSDEIYQEIKSGRK
ncbi:hypothetical protein ACFLSX_00725 [Calditrichota bacterium]